MKCLRKEPEKRYPSADALANDLNCWLRGEPIEARPVGQMERTLKWVRRNRMVAGLGAALVVVLLLGTTFSMYFAFGKALEAEQARDARSKADAHRYVSDMQLAQRAWEDNRIDWLTELLVRHEPSGTENEDHRGFEWHYWRRMSHAELVRIKHGTRVNTVRFSPDSRRVVTTGDDSFVHVWDSGTGEHLLSLSGHEGQVFDVTFTPDGTRIVSVSADKTARIWNAHTGEMLMTLKDHDEEIKFVAVDSAGQRIATASMGKTAQVWELATGKRLFELKLDRDLFTGVAFNRHSRLMTIHGGGRWRFWHAQTGTQKGEEADDDGLSTAWSLAISPDGDRYAVSHADGSVRVLDHNLITRQTLRGHNLPVYGIRFSRDSKRIVTASGDASAKLWDALSGEHLDTIRGHTDWVASADFDFHGRRVVTGSHDGTARIWSAVRETPPAEREFRVLGDGPTLDIARRENVSRHTESPRGPLFGPVEKTFADLVAVSPDGRHSAEAPVLGEGRVIIVSDRFTKQQITKINRSEDYWGLMYHPNGKQLLGACFVNTLRFWDVYSGQERGIVQQVPRISSVAFSPDGSRLALASFEGEVSIYDSENQAKILAFRAHPKAINRLVYSPDGRCLATASDDTTARVWDSRTGDEILTLKRHSRAVNAMAYSPDGQRLATVSDDNTLRIWHAQTGQEVSRSAHKDTIQRRRKNSEGVR